jgi:hypothetical protein
MLPLEHLRADQSICRSGQCQEGASLPARITVGLRPPLSTGSLLFFTGVLRRSNAHSVIVVYIHISPLYFLAVRRWHIPSVAVYRVLLCSVPVCVCSGSTPDLDGGVSSTGRDIFAIWRPGHHQWGTGMGKGNQFQVRMDVPHLHCLRSSGTGETLPVW